MVIILLMRILVIISMKILDNDAGDSNAVDNADNNGKADYDNNDI